MSGIAQPERLSALRAHLGLVAERKRLHTEAIAQLISAKMAAGMTAAEIAAAFNAEGRLTSHGGAWTEVRITSTYRRYIPPEARIDHRAKAAARAGTLRREKADRHNRLIVPRIIGLRRAGRSLARIAYMLNSEGLSSSSGGPWTPGTLSDIIRRYAPPAELAELSRLNPQGWESVRRQRQCRNAAIAPRMLALWREGLDHGQIADRLNAEPPAGGYPGRRRPWSVRTVRRVLVAHTDPEEYASLVTASKKRAQAKRHTATRVQRLAPAPGGRMRGIFAKHAEAKEREAALVPRVLQLFEEGLSAQGVARGLNAAGSPNGRGLPWNGTHVMRVLGRHLDPAECRAIAERGRKAGAEIRHRAMKAHYAAILPRIVELRNDGREYAAIARQLDAEGYRTFRGGAFSAQQVEIVVNQLFHGGAAVGNPPVIFGTVGKPVQVLGIDGEYREKSFGIGSRAESRWRVAKALQDAGPKGLTKAELENASPGWKGIVERLTEDAAWKAIIYPAERNRGLGWRIGPPRNIDADS